MIPLCVRHGHHGISYSDDPPGRGPRRRLVLLACLVLVAMGGLTLGACGPVGSTRADPIHAGFVTIRFRNDGAEPHQAQVLRLHDGVTPDRLAADATLGTDEILRLGT